MNAFITFSLGGGGTNVEEVVLIPGIALLTFDNFSLLAS